MSVFEVCLQCLTISTLAWYPDNPGPPSLEASTLSELEGLELSPAQVERIKEFSEDFGPRIAKAEAEAQETPAQKTARREAVRKAVADGKKGREAAKAIRGSVQFTPEQRAAARTAQGLRQEFEYAVQKALTKEQIALLEPGNSKATQYSGIIVVRLTPSNAVSREDTGSLIDFARRKNLQELAKVLTDLELNRSWRAVSQETLDQLPPKYARLRERLSLYWKIDATGNAGPIDQIVARLKALSVVDAAYRELAVREPGGFHSAPTQPASDPYVDQQGYLEAAPQGIDARFAWQTGFGNGEGVGLVDLERSWNVFHEEFDYFAPLLIYGDIRAGDHGTAVLGEIVAQENAAGIVGIAPETSYVFLSSWHHHKGPDKNIEQAVLEALPLMFTGDVLLLEVERSGLPTEVDEIDFDVIQAAVAGGIIVVEAAGNGGADLDAFENDDSEKILNRSDPAFRDSGAILVGASDPKDSHNRCSFSNFGSRLDCFAWGRHVVTSGYGDLSHGGGDMNKTYTSTFNGTSSSAPIVAGAALIVQGMALKNSATLYSPQEMRAILSNPATGTPQGSKDSGAIGVMPNLKAIIEACPVRRPPCPASRH